MNTQDHDLILTDASSTFLHFLRGTAAHAVVIGHGLSFFAISGSLSVIQNSAVVVFFILSGIVIPLSTFSKLQHSSGYSFREYFLERFSRIYTAFIPVLFFVLVVDTLSKAIFKDIYAHNDSFNARTFFGNLLMLQDFPYQSYISSYGSARPFWTIAIEWWIYMLFGWIVFSKSAKHSFLYWMVFPLFLFVPAYNLADGRGHCLSLIWIMGLVVYVAMHHLARRPTAPSKRSAQPAFISNQILIVLALVSLGLAFNYLSKTNNPYDAIYAGLWAMAVYFVLHLLQRCNLRCPVAAANICRFNANISYTLYLIHYTVLEVVVAWLGPGLRNMLIGMIICNLLAITMYWSFDRNYKRVGVWLKYFFRPARS